jgi:hypothetical protein
MNPTEQEHSNEWPKENAFDIPENYFQELPESIKHRIFPTEEKQTLYQLKDVDVFLIPEGYFNHLPKQIAAKTTERKPVIRVFTLKRLLYYSAAAVAVIAVGIVLLFNKQEPKHLTWEHIGEDEMAAYLENDLSLDVLAQAYLENTSEPAVVKTPQAADSSEGIEQYLLDNTDTYDLIEEDI